MANKKKNNKSKINIYWFYASIVFFILSIGLLGGDSGIQNTQQTDISSFENYLRNGDIEKVANGLELHKATKPPCTIRY